MRKNVYLAKKNLIALCVDDILQMCKNFTSTGLSTACVITASGMRCPNLFNL